MDVMKVLHMNKGKGENSYAKNSAIPRKVMSVTRPIIEEAVVNFLMKDFPESMGIADLGCASGPNTLIVISNIMDIVYSVSRQMNLPIPEFRVGLNDLPYNDFNDIFMSLPDFHNKTKQEKEGGFERCFISGVPGSFYGRLFPNNNLHFVHSSTSLHWLSKVPATLNNKVNIKLNKGKIYISEKCPNFVLDAYSLQFQQDFSVFLKSRSEEVVGGGHMVLSFIGRRSKALCGEEECFPWEILAKALMSMVSEGLVKEGDIDSFNVPIYNPCPEDVKAEIEKEGSFIMDRFEAFEIRWDGGDQSNFCSQDLEFTTWETLSSGKRLGKTIRSVVESMLKSHFGGEIMDELFKRFSDIADGHLSKCQNVFINFVIHVIRKG